LRGAGYGWPAFQSRQSRCSERARLVRALLVLVTRPDCNPAWQGTAEIWSRRELPLPVPPRVSPGDWAVGGDVHRAGALRRAGRQRATRLACQVALRYGLPGVLAPNYPAWQGAIVGTLNGGASSTSRTVSHVGSPGGDGLRRFDEQGDRVVAPTKACRALAADDRRRRTRPAAPGAAIEPEHVVAGRRRPLCSPPA
jgi:hypothetical protein